MTTFLLIRHAEKAMPSNSIAGWTPEIHLNEEGREQAQRLATRLAHAPIAAIYSSPLERCRETIAPLAARLGLSIQISEELGEIHFGDWTGREIDDLRPVPQWQYFNAFRSGTRVPGGELMVEVQARAVSEIERLSKEYPTEVVAVVSHGDVIRAILANYAGIHIDLFQRIEISPASLSVLVLKDYGPHIWLINDTGELPDLNANR